MARKNVSHRIEHTRNKHSRAVYQDETIIIRLARNLSRLEERDHIENLLRRMTRQVLEEQQKTLLSPFRHLLQGGQSQTITLSTGKKYVITLNAADKSSIRKTSEGWAVSIGPAVRRRGLHKALWHLIAKAEQKRIDVLVRSINDETYQAKIRTVKLKFASSQWGSCSPRGDIMLNAALLFVQPSVLRYVIIHELAHRRKADHSPAYWREVEWALPTYQKHREALQEYRLPSL